MDVSWSFLGWGIGGQLAGHIVGWGLSGSTLSQITSPPSLMAVGLSLGSELAVLGTGNDGIMALLPNAAQVGTIAYVRGLSATDPQLLGSVGSGLSKTLYAFQR